jgi:hypothetical protein
MAHVGKEESEHQERHRKALDRYRDELLQLGMPRDRVDGLVRFVGLRQVLMIKSLDDYHRACRLRDEMVKQVSKGDFLSVAALRLYLIGEEISQFQKAYEGRHGCVPPRVRSI